MMSKKHDFTRVPKSVRDMLRTVPVTNHLRVHACYNTTVGPDWRITDRVIEDYHLLMVLAGEGTYRVGDRTVPLFRGRLIFLTNGVTYSAEQQRDNPPRIAAIRFFPYRNSNGQPAAPFAEPASIVHVTNTVAHYEKMFETLYRENLLNQGPFRTGYCSSILHHILCNLFTEAQDSGHGVQPDGRILKAQQFIASHPVDRSSVHELAARVGLSEKYFSKLFREQVGMTPKSYQVSARLNHARNLLEHTSLPVRKIAEQLGYPDPYVFSKQFKSLFGAAPSSVR